MLSQLEKSDVVKDPYNKKRLDKYRKLMERKKLLMTTCKTTLDPKCLSDDSISPSSATTMQKDVIILDEKIVDLERILMASRNMKQLLLLI